MKKFLFLFSAASFSFVLSAENTPAATPAESVFSDATIWIKGAYDQHADGIAEIAYDFRNARSAGSTIPGAGSWGSGENRSIKKEDVVCPYANTVISDAPCVVLEQNVVDNPETGIGECNYASFRVFNANAGIAITNNECSIVMRLRPDERMFDRFMIFGGVGFSVGFIEDSARPGLNRLFAYCGNYPQTSYYVTPGTWMDLAVVRTDYGLQFYAVTNNGAFWTEYKNANNINVAVTNTVIYLANSNVGNYGKIATNNTTSIRKTSFRGAIHQFALWNRRLTEAEVREAFAYPRTDVFRVGMDNASGGEFIKASPDGTAVNPDDWYTMPRALAPGESVDIAFTVGARENGLPQLLRVGSVDGGAKLALAVNGIARGGVDEAVDNGVRRLDAECFQSGENVLRLTNTGTGSVAFDYVQLGGSWRIGLEDGDNAEFSDSPVGGGKTVGTDSACGVWRQLAGSVKAGGTNRVSVTIPAAVAAAGCPLRFSMYATLPAEAEAGYAEQYDWSLLVNGEMKKTGRFSSASRRLSVRFEPGELAAGTNTFSVVHEKGSSGNDAAFGMDYWRFELWQDRGMQLMLR